MCRKISRVQHLKYLITLITILIIGMSSAVTAAGGITLAEALKQGLEHNAEIQQQWDELQGIETALRELAAGMDWQVDLAGNTTYGSNAAGLMKNYYSAENKAEDAGGMAALSLNVSKSYFSGLQLSTELSLRETQPFRFEDMADKYSFGVNFNQRLYPGLPSQMERQYFQRENQWKVRKIQYDALLRSKEADWLELYLNLISLKKDLVLAGEGYVLAEKGYEQVRGEEKIGEAGKTQVLTAGIELKEAELNLKKARSSSEQASDRFYQTLGLDDTRPGITGAEKYLDEVKERVNSVETDYYNLDNLAVLMVMVEEHNYQAAVLKENIAYKKRELKWQQAEERPRLSATGNYNYNQKVPGDDEWQVGLGVSYNLFDSGRKKAALEGKQGELNSLERQYKTLLKELEMGLEGLINQLELDLMDRDSRVLAHEKAELEAELAEKQLEEGLITGLQYRRRLIQVEDALNNLAVAEGRILLDKLRILNYLGLETQIKQ